MPITIFANVPPNYCHLHTYMIVVFNPHSVFCCATFSDCCLHSCTLILTDKEFACDISWQVTFVTISVG